MRTRTAVLLILALWVVIYLPGLFTPALLDDADSAHAEAAKEIVLRGDWVTLHVNGIRYMEKAPLMYWTIAATYQLFGVTEWTSRLSLTLFVLAALLAVFFAARRAYARGAQPADDAGLYAALILGASFGPYVFTRILIPDIIVGLWLTLVAHFFLQTLRQQQPSRALCWGIAAVSALNVLTKGLIGVVFPVGMMVAYLLLTRDLRRLLRMRLLSSTLVFLAIATPWHALAALRNPDQGAMKGFLWFYFMNEHIYRYLGKRVPVDYDKVPFLLFWGLILVWLLPWSTFLFPALAGAVRSLRARLAALRDPAAPEADRANLLFLIWALMILVFFSFSTRQEYYVVPALPALALIIAGWLARESDAPADAAIRRTARLASLVLLVIAALVLAGAAAFVFVSAPPPPGAELADLLTKNPEYYALSFGHFTDLTPEALGLFRLPLLVFAGSLFAGALAAWLLRRRGRALPANLAYALMMVGVLWAVHHSLVMFEPVLSSKQLARAIAREYQPGDLVIIEGQYEEGSTLNFYLNVPVRVLNGDGGNLWYASRFPDAPRVMENDASFRQLWNSPQRVFLWTQKPRPELFAGSPPYELAQFGGKWILTNRPPKSSP